MSAESIDDHRLDAAMAALRRCDAVQAVYLLGSAAADRLRVDSDVDLAILPSRAAGLSVEERVSLTQAGTPALGAAGSLDAASPLVVETGGTFATGGKSQAFPAERSP